MREGRELMRARLAGLVSTPGRRLVTAVLAAGLVIGTAGGLVAALRAEPAAAPAARSGSVASAGSAGRIQDPVAGATAAPAGVPVHVTIPAIGVDAPLGPLATDASGKLQPPASPHAVGWYAAGVVPGQIGPAIIAAHVDYSAGPGAFEHLDELRPGDVIRVTLSTGRTVEFRMTGSQQAAKVAFPTAAVYGTTPDPELRLITCAGTFDTRTAHYLDNLVVFATEVAPDQEDR